MKLCLGCETEKPDAEFYRDSSRPDGLNWRCKPCHKAHVARIAMQPPRNPAPEGMKRCGRCKATKSIGEFYGDSGRYDGKSRTCKQCADARHKDWSAKNPGYMTRKSRESYAKDPERYADYELKKRLGLPAGTYDKMLAAQGAACAICGTDKPGGKRRRFAVDHCHETGKVRALLCNNCNIGLGHLDHDPDRIRAAISYLSKHLSAEGA